PAVAADRRAPSDRRVGVGQLLEYAQLRSRVEFAAAPRARHRHAKDAGFLKLPDELRRQAPLLLDVVARGYNTGLQRHRCLKRRLRSVRCIERSMSSHRVSLCTMPSLALAGS